MSRESKHKTEATSDPAQGELQQTLEACESPEAACSKLAQILRVSRNEIALLRLEKGTLRFIYPAEFHNAGAIPLSGSAVAGRTAVTRTPFLSNSFARVKHVSLFESVKLHTGESGEQSDPMPIQKIISVPMIAAGEKVVGVVQISRKGLDPSLAGADFTPEDMKLLEQAATILASLPFMGDDASISQASS